MIARFMFFYKPGVTERHRANPLPGQPSRGALASARSRAHLLLTVGPTAFRFHVEVSYWLVMAV